MDATVAEMTQRQQQVAEAATLGYWFERAPERLPFDQRMLLARASLVTFKLMVRVGV